MQMYRMGYLTDYLLCGGCISDDEKGVSIELQERHFPGAYHRLVCRRCGASPEKAPAVETSEA